MEPRPYEKCSTRNAKKRYPKCTFFVKLILALKLIKKIKYRIKLRADRYTTGR